MVLPLILVGFGILVLAIYYWYITIPIVIIIYALYKYNISDSKNKINNEYKKDNSEHSNYQKFCTVSEKDIIKSMILFGLTTELTKDQIKTRYRELSIKFHPDKNKTKDTTMKMTDINKAYEILINLV